MTNQRPVPTLIVLLLTAFCLLPTAFSQSATATLSGSVVDQNGAMVPGTTVTVENAGMGLKRDATTNSEGYFTFPLLSPGAYTVRAQHDGFKLVQIDIVLNVGDQKVLQIPLQTGDVKEVVNVTAETPLINESPAVATVVDRQFVANLPLNGRSFQSLITLAPGIVLTKTNFNEQGQFSVNGQRADANYFTVDGVSANIGVSAGASLGQSSGGALPGFSAAGGTNNLVSVDALQEFKIQTSAYAPEFGRTPGAQVQILTRSGTNEFRGSVFEYFRNDVFDANDWFANANSLPKPALRQNDFGGVLGGPIVRNKTFIFFSYEGLRLRQPQTQVTTVPTVAARQAAPIAVQPLLNAYPRPNGRDLGNGLAEFSSSFSNPATLNATSIRVDQTVNSKLTLFGRYNYAPSDSVQHAASAGQTLNTLTLTQLKTQTLTGGATWAITPAISNELRANYSRSRGANFISLDDSGGALPPADSAIFPNSFSSADALFQVYIIGPNIFYNIGKNTDNLQRQFNLVDNAAIITGSHQLKFGVDYRRLSTLLGIRPFGLFIYFNGVAEALSGRSIFVLTEARAPVDVTSNNLSLFGQDTWKVTPRLTLTYGLRWEVNPAPTGLYTISGVDDPATTKTLAPAGTPLWKSTYNNFAPRAGVAYQLSQRQGREMILRGGFGIFYDLGTSSAGSGTGAAPFVSSNLLFDVPLPLDAAQATPPPFSLDPPYGFAVGFDPNLKLPLTYQWNLAVEQSLGSDQTISASYLGAAARRLLRLERFSNPNPNFQTLDVVIGNATSDYNAMQLQYQRRLSRGLQVLSSYTWSHSIDTASNDSIPGTPRVRVDPRQDRGSSNFDVRHAFSAAVTYNLPKPAIGKFGVAFFRDWSIDAVYTARSATPINVVTGVGLFGIFPPAGRPDLIPGVPLYIDDSSVGGGRRINRAAFAVPPAGRQGTLGRNTLRGFSMWQLDLSVRRQFILRERVNLQFRAEFFNLFNHPNFGDPGFGFSGTNALNNPLFGQSTQMLGRSLGIGGVNGGFNPLYQVGGPRSIQFALKLAF